jgi:protein phosphatase
MWILPHARKALCVSSFGLTDCGKVRPNNEDQFLIASLVKTLQVEQTSLAQPALRLGIDHSHLFIVADGMGGHAGGQRASALAVDSVERFVLDTLQWFAKFKGQQDDRVLTEFQQALGQANARVLAEAAERPALHGMGTTLTLAYTLNDVLFVAHAGDTRCYLGRSQALYRLTRDHTLAEEMRRRDLLSAEDAEHHHWRHVVTNVIGGDTTNVEVEVHKIGLEAGDRLLLCSDGLTGMISEEEINLVLWSEAEPERACRQLVGCANEAGGKDNITVIVAHFRSAEEAEVAVPSS